MVPLWRLMLWFLRNVARNSPTCISNIEITSLEFCGFLDTYEKLGYPNYVRVLVDEAPKANSCVRSSSHDTIHDPREASNTTPTPQNAKSPQTAVHFVENCRIWRVLAEVDCALSKTRGMIGPMGGALRPWMRTLTLEVEHGRGRPCSTYRAQLRIDGCVQPVVGCGA